MPIWSLTKERIDKLNHQIDERTQEVDLLSGRTVEDLWKADLDDFIQEWRFQLDDEAKRVKKAANEGRRASKKLNIGGAAGRKRKAGNSDDSDFDVAPAKAKKAAAKAERPVGGILSYLNECDKSKKPGKPKGPSAVQKKVQTLLQSGVFDTTAQTKQKELKKPTGPNINMDGASDPAETQATTSAKKQGNDGSDDDTEELLSQPAGPGRRPRAAAAKPVKYDALSDSDSDGEDMLFDVGKMVKGIDTANASSDNSRPLFSTSASASRPGSSAELPRKSTSLRDTIDLDADDTDYTKLVPPTTSKGPAITARSTVLSDDEDDRMDSLDELPASPPKKVSKAARLPKVASTNSSKPLSKPVSKPKSKTAAATKRPTPAPQAPAPPRSSVLSPAAKAYAAKKAKAAAAAAKQDEEAAKIADEIMEDDDDILLDEEDDEEEQAVKRPARRAAAAASKKKKWLDSDEEEEDEDDEDPSEDAFDDDDDADETF